MLKSLDRIKELTSTTGTGTLTLTGAESGFQAFSVLGNGTKCYYTITDVNGTDFEVGQGTYNTNTLTRDTIFESSNSGNAISLSATGSTVFVTYPAEKSSYRDIGVNRDYTASGSITAGKPLILNADNTVSQVATTTSSDVAISNTTGAGIVDSSSSEKQAFNFYCSAQNTFVAGYIASNGYPTIVAYTVATDGSVTSGTPVALKSIGSYTIDGILTSGSTVVFTYGNNSGDPTYGYIRAGTLSGTTFTLGTELEVSSASNYYNYMYCSLGYDSNADAGLVTYSYNSTETIASASIKSKVFTLSGTTITLGSETAIDTTTGKFGNFTWGYYGVGSCLKTVFDPDNNLIVSIRSYPTGQGTESVDAYVGTITGGSTRSVSWGAKQTIKANTAGSDGTNQPKYVKQIGAIYDTINNRLLIGNVDDNSSNLVANWKTDISNCTINSNSTITVNSSTEVATFRNYPSFAFINENNSYLFVLSANEYYDNSAYDVFYKVVPSSTAVTVSTLHTSNFGSKYTGGIAYNSTDKTTGYLTYWYANSTDFTYDLVVRSGGFSTNVNLTNDNYFGIASTTASTTEPVGVNRAGSFNNDQTGMTAGKDYYAKNDGTIVERTSTIPDTTPSSTDFITYASSQIGNSIKTSIAYDTTNDKIGVLNYGTGGADYYPRLTIGTESGSSITWGTPVIVYSGNGGNERGYQLTYGNGAFIGTYATSSKGYVFGATYTGTNSATIGTRVQPFSGDLYRENCTISYNPNENKFVFIAKELNTTDFKLYIITNSGTTLTVGNSATLSVTANTYSHWFNGYDPDTHRTVIAISYVSGSGNDKIYTANISGSNITASTNYLSVGNANFAEGNQSMNYDPDNNKWLYLDIDDDSTDQNIYATVLTASSDTFTKGTRTLMNSVKSRYMASYYDTEQNKSVVPYQLYDSSASEYYGKIGVITISGTTPSWTDSTNTIGNTTTDRTKPQASLFNPDTNKGVVIADRQTNNEGVSALLSFGSTISVNASQFVGTARSGTDLELAEPPTELVGMANGSITKGKPVILRTDGDFEEVKANITTIAYSNGSEEEISAGWLDMHSVSYDTVQNRFLAVYRDQDASNYGYSKSFTVSNNTISNIVSGSAFNTNTTTILDSCYVGNSKHVVIYKNSSSYLVARCITLASDGSTTEGTANVIYSGNTNNRGSCYYDSKVGAVVIVTSFVYDNYKAQVGAVYVDGTNLPAGNFVVNPSNETDCYYFSSSYDEEAQIGIVAYGSDNNKGVFNTINITDNYNTVSWNTDLTFNSYKSRISADGMTYDPKTKKHLCLFADDQNSNDLYGIVATVSGTSVTHGTKAVISTDSNDNLFGCQGTDGGGISYAHRGQASPYYLKGGVATISGTSFTLTNSNTYNSTDVGSNNSVSFAYQPSDYTTLAVYEENGAHDLQGLAIIPEGSITTFNLGATNFIGFAQDTVADNEDVKVKVISQSDENQTGLTTASQYYVQTDGTLSTTAGTPSVLGGTALSSTKILIKS
jgi:hypothetical protein